MFLEMEKNQCVKLIFKNHFQWSVPPGFKLWRIRKNLLQRFEKSSIRLRIKILFWDIECVHFRTLLVPDRNITKKSGNFLIGEVFFLLDLTFKGDPFLSRVTRHFLRLPFKH